jgi:hypothetical protein
MTGLESGKSIVGKLGFLNSFSSKVARNDASLPSIQWPFATYRNQALTNSFRLYDSLMTPM